jgi:hypothetical protein
MPDDWVNRNTLALIAQVDQFITALNNPGGLTASGLTGAQLTNLGTMNTALQTDHTDQLAKEAAFRASVDLTQADQAALTAEFRSLGRAANGNSAMTDAYRAAAGLTIRDLEPSPGDLPLIEDLAVIGRPNGNNFLDWGTPVGVAPGIVWEVQCALGATAPFGVVGATSRTDFLHEGAGAGVHRIYRVVATRGNRRGEPGNEAAVYG